MTIITLCTDVNDNSPVFTSLPSQDLGEDTSQGTTVGTVAAVDADTGVNGKV